MSAAGATAASKSRDAVGPGIPGSFPRDRGTKAGKIRKTRWNVGYLTDAKWAIVSIRTGSSELSMPDQNSSQPLSADSQNLLLAGLDTEALALLRPHLKPVALAQKSVLHEAGDRIDHVYFPLSGMVSMLAVLENGDSVEIAAIGREGAVGTKFGSRPQLSFARAIVQLDGKALRIDMANFSQAAAKSTAIAELAMWANDILVANIQQSAACNAIHGLESRLARWLLHASDRYQSDELPLTQEFLSEMLGVRRTTVSLTAQILQNAGVLKYRRGNLMIVDRAGLEAVSCECYDAVKQNISRIVEPLQKPR
jgi:CRP-like cAMP-binding protein